jgi:hypothetical protein
VLRLLPLSFAELFARPPLDPDAIDRLPPTVVAPPRTMWDVVFAGLYPRVHEAALDPARWYADYHRTYVERDLRDVLRVMDLAAFDRFVRAAAASTGQELVLASLAADVGISLHTAKSWLSALGVGFIDYTPYLLPLTLVFLIVTLAVLAWRPRRGYAPLALGLAASAMVLVGKFSFDSETAVYSGVALLVVASGWNAWPAPRAACPACEIGTNNAR